MHRRCYMWHLIFFFFNDTATTEIYTLSLHDALPISSGRQRPGAVERGRADRRAGRPGAARHASTRGGGARRGARGRSEEHTSELQSQSNIVCRLLLEKKKNTKRHSVRTWRS